MHDKPVWSIIRSVLGKNRILLIGLALTIVLVITGSLIPPQILRIIIDRNLVVGKTDRLLALAVAYLAVLIFTGFFDFIKEVLLTVLGQSMTQAIRVGMKAKLGRISARYFSSHEAGTIHSRFTQDVDTISALFTGGVAGLVIDLLKIVGIVISIGMFQATLGWLTLLLLPILILITRFFQNRMLKAQKQNRVLVGQVNNHLSESIKTIRMIKSFSKEGYMEKRFRHLLSDNFSTVEKINFFDSIYPPMIQMLRALVIAALVILASKQLNFPGFSLGMVAASIDFISNLFSPIESLGMEIQSIQQAIAGLARVQEFLLEEEDVGKKADLTADRILGENRHIELAFRQVSFSYQADVEVLEEVDLVIRPGEKVTFVGRTGVGKSTLFKLVMGLMLPTRGVITVNGIDVFAIPNTEKRKIFGYVDQDIHLIKGTVADQVSLLDETVTREQIERALERVGLAEYVAAMAYGLDTPVNGDNLFSRGQLQLLAMARAVVLDPPLLLLDETTANLDAITEEKLISALKKSGPDHTILSISHRLSGMLTSDRIVILEKGQVKGDGSPEALSQHNAWYRDRLAMEKLTWS